MEIKLHKIENFLTIEECDFLIKEIDKDPQRSCVASPDYYDNPDEMVSDYRTSSTKMLDEDIPIISNIKERIRLELGIDDIKKAQQLEGQRYLPGEYFREHNDWFDDSNYIDLCLHSGNRTHTFMVYLNEPEVGGQTYFRLLGEMVKPKKGMAIWWPNVDNDGEALDMFLHEGMEVLDGSKYIITSWWTENEYNPIEDARLGRLEREKQFKSINGNYIEPLQVSINSLNIDAMESNEVEEVAVETLNKVNKVSQYSNKLEYFNSSNQLPKCTPLGFTKIKCPAEIMGIINDSYNILKDRKLEETFYGKDDTILGIGNTSDMINFEHIPNIRTHIHNLLKPLHEEWSNQELEPTMVYGIRSYNKGSSLIEHVDREATHHISAIVMVDKDLGGNPDWPLSIIDHNGREHKIYTEVGDIILYESAICKHARYESFKGNYFRNFYVHYKLKNWIYTGSEI